LASRGDQQALEFVATSDSSIVSGLIALLLRTYSGLSAQAIIETEPRFIAAIGLQQHLSPTRSNGLLSMLHTIKSIAAAALNKV
jgi:cysteine desulfuration protein SufE